MNTSTEAETEPNHEPQNTERLTEPLTEIGVEPTEDEPENDRHSDIEIIQPNSDPLPVVGNVREIREMSGHGMQDMSANEEKSDEITQDEIKISRETMLKMMMEINQLKQAQIARENSEQKKSDEVSTITTFINYKYTFCGS